MIIRITCVLLSFVALLCLCLRTAAETVRNNAFSNENFPTEREDGPDAKMAALQWHRDIQAGIRKREEMINVLKRKIAHESRTKDALRADLSSVEKIWLKMRYWMKMESAKQASQQFTLLREREAKCISGYEEKCNYFQEGFMDDNELFVRNAPAGFMQKTRKRTDIRTRTAKDSEYLRALSSTERVRTSLCDAVDLIPDETLRAFTTVGEYLYVYL